MLKAFITPTNPIIVIMKEIAGCNIMSKPIVLTPKPDKKIKLAEKNSKINFWEKCKFIKSSNKPSKIIINIAIVNKVNFSNMSVKKTAEIKIEIKNPTPPILGIGSL